jgi:hypothetical protein
MTIFPLVLAFILYTWIAITYGIKKDWPMLFIFLCYAGSQIGFIWIEKLKHYHE